jgi:hypothetical protein
MKTYYVVQKHTGDGWNDWSCDMGSFEEGVICLREMQEMRPASSFRLFKFEAFY